MMTVRYFGSRNYDWSGLSEQKTVIGKAKRSVLQFSPHSWDDFDWRLTSSPLRCIQCLFPIVLILLMEVNPLDCPLMEGPSDGGALTSSKYPLGSWDCPTTICCPPTRFSSLTRFELAEDVMSFCLSHATTQLISLLSL